MGGYRTKSKLALESNNVSLWGEVMALELVLFRSFFCFSTYTISYAVRANDFLCGKLNFIIGTGSCCRGAEEGGSET